MKKDTGDRTILATTVVEIEVRENGSMDAARVLGEMVLDATYRNESITFSHKTS